MVRRWICVAALGVLAALYAPRLCAQAAFPYDRDLVLDARPMRGGKRVPILSVGADGHAQIDLWCKRGHRAGGDRRRHRHDHRRRDGDEPCTPERAQADEQMIAALSAVTNWSFRGDVVTFSGGATLRFRAAAN